MKINTKYGEMDESLLVKAERHDISGAAVVEYYLKDELVHRSVTVHLRGTTAAGVAQKI